MKKKPVKKPEKKNQGVVEAAGVVPGAGEDSKMNIESFAMALATSQGIGHRRAPALGCARARHR